MFYRSITEIVFCLVEISNRSSTTLETELPFSQIEVDATTHEQNHCETLMRMTDQYLQEDHVIGFRPMKIKKEGRTAWNDETCCLYVIYNTGRYFCVQGAEKNNCHMKYILFREKITANKERHFSSQI